jgi:molybdate transport system ATP-binding protein
VLRADLARRFGDFQLQVSLEAAPVSTLVLVGESGSGKTTVLRLLAGLLDPHQGHISLEGHTWFDAVQGTALPGWRRPVGYVAQDYALFPHLSVFDNVAFGCRARGESSRSTRERVGNIMERFRLTSLGSRRPADLSGGQQQRVAVARALVLEPKLLLLDEPLSALDVKTRREVRQELRQLLSELTCITVLVTHHPVEALVFGDRVTVMAQGRAEQAGTRDDLLCRPRSPHIAEFMGVNLIRGVVGTRDGSGLARLLTAEGEIVVVDPGEAGAEMFVSISPREITLHREAPGGSAQNVFAGRVKELIPEPPDGRRVRVALGTHPPLVAEVTRPAVEALGLGAGVMVYAAFKASGVIPYK